MILRQRFWRTVFLDIPTGVFRKTPRIRSVNHGNRLEPPCPQARGSGAPDNVYEPTKSSKEKFTYAKSTHHLRSNLVRPRIFTGSASSQSRRRTDAILISPRRKGAMRLTSSPPVRETRELAGIRCFRIPPATSTPELAPERWLSTTRITTPQLALEHCFSTPLANRTLPLELTRLSITTAAPTTTPSAQMRSLVTSKVLSTTHMVVTHLHQYGSENNAFGDLAMENNTSGSSNTAIGDDALRYNVDGSGNVAVGDEAGTGLGEASVTASRSAHLVQVLLLTLITPASSAASTVSRLATPAPPKTSICRSI